jgi:hypothetical protein
VLAEPAGSTLAAKKRRQVAPLVKATSTPKNRVWGFADSPSGRPVADLHLNQENATGSVQFTYETASGRAYFLSRDPLGFKAGPNMYTYVRQNPWTHFDPEGLDNNPPPPPPPPPPTQHAPPPKQTVQAPPPPHPPGPPGIDPAATVTSPKPVSSPPAASAKSTDPAKGGESNKPNTEAAGQVSDVAGGATEIGKASNLKVMSNVTSGALSTYTTNFYGNKSVAMLANVGKASDVAGKILKPLAVASFAAGVVGDVKAVKSGQESVPLALAKTGWGAAGFASPHVAAAQAGWAVGQMIANHPMGNGMTVGEQAGQGMYRVAPGLFNYLVR